MDRQTEAKLRYERLKKALADDHRVRKKRRWVRLAGILAVGAWATVPILFWEVDLETAARKEFFRTPTPHEAYGLELAGSASGSLSSALPSSNPSSALVADPRSVTEAWNASAFRAIDLPLSVGPAYQEVGLFPADDPQALGLRVHVPEGQRLRLTVEAEGESLTRLFVDMYRAAPASLVHARAENGDGGTVGDEPRPAFVEAGRLTEGHWYFDAPRTADYVLRLQPELQAAGPYRVSVQVGARWLFPVAGAGEEDIGGFFGDPRDGGSRVHHGVDIFMPRGTPVLAAADGRVTSVDTTNIGGRVVWQREAGGRHTLYYAHLDQPLVQDGQQVRVGDAVGLVGNTGNARTTPPHLHFGAYRRGAVDPWSLILPVPPELPGVSLDIAALGESVTVGGSGAFLRRSPSGGGTLLAELDGGSSVRILAGANGWYRVLMPDGRSGFVESRQMAYATPYGTRPSNQ